MNSLTRFYAPLCKVDHQRDGTLKVSGIASSEAVDSDGEIILASAIRDALPDFFRLGGSGPLREMHQPIAAGTVDDAEVVDGDTWITATVVDKAAIEKVEKRVYRGFSIGGRVVERHATNRKIIKKIRLHEISLVDRPSNPDAVFDIWKATMAEIESPFVRKVRGALAMIDDLNGRMDALTP